MNLYANCTFFGLAYLPDSVREGRWCLARFKQDTLGLGYIVSITSIVYGGGSVTAVWMAVKSVPVGNMVVKKI